MDELRKLAEQQDGVIYIEQLEEWHRGVVERLERELESAEVDFSWNYAAGMERALEIVRNGGKE